MSEQAVQTVLVQIKHRFTGATLFECAVPSNTPSGLRMRYALEKATAAKANLSGSDLSGSDLSGSDLSGSDLSDSNLSDSNLSDSNLRGSDLSGSDLRGSNLSDSNLRGSDLLSIKTDFWDVLLRAQPEVAQLRAALVGGQVNGSAYEGRCACLVGSIANFRGTNYLELSNNLRPDSGRPIERFFMGIKTGDTPETNPLSKVAIEWIDEFTALIGAAK